MNQHIAVSLDLRFYAVNPQDATAGRPAFPRMTILSLSADRLSRDLTVRSLMAVGRSGGSQ